MNTNGDDDGYPLITITFYGLAEQATAARALLAGVTVHGYLPDITPDDVRAALLAMAESLPAGLAQTWAGVQAQRN